jgi:hypothetical protein
MDVVRSQGPQNLASTGTNPGDCDLHTSSDDSASGWVTERLKHCRDVTGNQPNDKVVIKDSSLSGTASRMEKSGDICIMIKKFQLMVPIAEVHLVKLIDSEHATNETERLSQISATQQVQLQRCTPVGQAVCE